MIVYDSKDNEDIKIARLNVSKAEGDISILDFHYLIAEKGEDVKHVTEKHELGMFAESQMLEAIKEAGLEENHLESNIFGRSLYFGMKI
jgi:hypothetical protein